MTPPSSFSLTNWALTGLLSLALATGGWYAKWINDSFTTTRSDIQSIMLKRLDDQHNLDILNAKVDLILEYNGLKYNGPKFSPVIPKP